jgi:hypothetical protein
VTGGGGQGWGTSDVGRWPTVSGRWPAPEARPKGRPGGGGDKAATPPRVVAGVQQLRAARRLAGSPGRQPTTTANSKFILGTFYWQVVYSGDANNNGATSVCTSEVVVVTSPNGGCTPGFWKNHQELWSQFGYDPNASFATTFGLTSAQMTAAGLNPNLTLKQAIDLGGGGFQKLARHGVAGLLSSADSDVNYPYTTAQVIALVQSGMANHGTPGEPEATQLAAANDLSHANCG